MGSGGVQGQPGLSRQNISQQQNIQTSMSPCLFLDLSASTRWSSRVPPSPQTPDQAEKHLSTETQAQTDNDPFKKPASWTQKKTKISGGQRRQQVADSVTMQNQKLLVRMAAQFWV